MEGITIQKLYNEKRTANSEELDILFTMYVNRDIDRNLLAVMDHYEKVRIIVIYTYIKNVILLEKDKISVVKLLKAVLPASSVTVYKYIKQAKGLDPHKNELSPFRFL